MSDGPKEVETRRRPQAEDVGPATGEVTAAESEGPPPAPADTVAPGQSTDRVDEPDAPSSPSTAEGAPAGESPTGGRTDSGPTPSPRSHDPGGERAQSKVLPGIRAASPGQPLPATGPLPPTPPPVVLPVLPPVAAPTTPPPAGTLAAAPTPAAVEPADRGAVSSAEDGDEDQDGDEDDSEDEDEPVLTLAQRLRTLSPPLVILSVGSIGAALFLLRAMTSHTTPVAVLVSAGVVTALAFALDTVICSAATIRFSRAGELGRALATALLGGISAVICALAMAGTLLMILVLNS